MATHSARPVLRLAAEGGGGTLFTGLNEHSEATFWFSGSQLDWGDESEEDVWANWQTDATTNLVDALPARWYHLQAAALDTDVVFRSQLARLYESAVAQEQVRWVP